MSAHDVTAAVETGGEALHGRLYFATGITFDEAKAAVAEVLAAALDVEEMARVLHREGAWCGVCEYDGWGACKECRETVTGYAAALRAAILGGAA